MSPIYPGLMLGATVLFASSIGEASSSREVTPVNGIADCRVVLRGNGSYQLEVGTAGPIPVVEFKKATSPSFGEIIWEQGRRGSCREPLGTIQPLAWSRNSTPLLYLVSLEIQAETRLDRNCLTNPDLIGIAPALASSIQRRVIRP